MNQPQDQKPSLTVDELCNAASEFGVIESGHDEPTLFGVTEGKAVGTYIEPKFRAALTARFDFTTGSSAKGIDFPDLEVDMKATSIQ